MAGHIEDLFPKLRGSSYRITSEPDDRYNCIAWAAGLSEQWWWPTSESRIDFWPVGVHRLETVEAFRRAFETLGYVGCQEQSLEPGRDRIALFADSDGNVTHAARQLPSGRWTSKLGILEDIEHELLALEGAEYGSVALLMEQLSNP